MKKFIALLLCIPALVYGNEQEHLNELVYYDSFNQNNNCCYQNNCGYATTNCENNNNCLCFPWEFFVTADFIYWKFFQGGMEYATSYVPGGTAPVNVLPGAQSIFIDPHWKPGFRVGAGIYNCNCPFDLYVYYTRLRSKETTSATGALFPTLNFPGDVDTFATLATLAEAEWIVHFQTLDVDIGYYCCCNPWLILHPYLGLKTAWIDQDFDVDYAGLNTAPGQVFSVSTRNDFWGIGPKLGFEVEWYALKCLYVFGNFSGAILWGQFDNKQVQAQGTIAPDQINLKDKFDLITPTIQTVVGLGYSQNVCLCSRQFNIGLRIAAEAQYWWAQNQRQHFTANVGAVHLISQSDLSLIGLTISGMIGF